MTGDSQTFNAELDKIAAERDPGGFNLLVSAAFYNAMRRRFGNGVIERMEHKTIGGLQLVFLTVSVMDEGMTTEQIDAFLVDARQLAEA